MREFWTPDRRVVLSIALVACLLYGNTASNPLVFDDLELISHQKAIRNPGDLQAIFGGRYWGEVREEDVLYRPLTIWSLALNYRANQMLGLPGEHPAGFHLLNVLLHALAGCLLYRFFLRVGMDRWAGLAAALLFAAHPIHTEAVAPIVNRSEPLAAVFGLVFLVLHRERRWAPVGALCYLLAMWSKESAVAFLPLVVWMDVSLGFGGRWRTAVSYGVYGLVTVGWFAVRAMAVGDRLQVVLKLDNPLVATSLVERVLTAARVQFEYLRLQFLPVGLSSDYSFNQIPVVSSVFDPGFLAFAAVVPASLVCGWLLRRRHPLVLFAVVGYAVLFLLTSNFLIPIGTVMGERLAYAPSLFFCMLLGYGMWVFYRRAGRAATIVLGAVLACYGALTVDRNRTWADDGIFFQTQVRSAPNSAKANYSAGRWYHLVGDVGRAVSYYRRAVEILPDYPDAWNNLGVAYKDKGDMQAAIGAYRRAIALHAGYENAHFNLGQAYDLLGEYNRAVNAYQTAIRLNPDYVEAHSNLGTIYANRGRLKEAEALWKRALELDPNYEIARTNLELLRQARQRSGEAR